MPLPSNLKIEPIALPILALFTLVFQVISPSQIWGQSNCPIPNWNRASLQTNDVEANLYGGGTIWGPGPSLKKVYEIDNPALPGEKAGLFFASGLWLGAKGLGANQFTAANTYGFFTGNTDFWPGPLDEQGQIEASVCENYNRFWKVKRKDIQSLLDDFTDGSVDEPIPTTLQEWPGRGNPYFFDIFGFQLPNTPQGLAPFFDQDGDGNYDPAQGDYPLIRDAEEAIWWIFNDAGGIHTQSGGSPINMEVQAMAYTYPSAPAPVDRATFYDFRFISRKVEPLDSVYVGFWVDPQLGSGDDDFFGFNQEHQLYYCYNKDTLDGVVDSLGNCNFGFCDQAPVIGIKILEGTKRIDPVTSELVDNGVSSVMPIWTANNFFNEATHLPNRMRPEETYNYLKGRWRDGSPLTRGGYGYNPGSSERSSYAFPDAPNDPNGWSLCTEDFPDLDFSNLINSGPYHADPGRVNSISFAVFLTEDVALPCPALDQVLDNCVLIEQHFQNLPTATQDLPKADFNIQFAPNPFHDYTILTSNIQGLNEVELLSLDGQIIRRYTNLTDDQLRIERQNLPVGMYLYRGWTNQGRSTSGKLLIH